MTHYLSFNKISEPEQATCTLSGKRPMASSDSCTMQISLPRFSDYQRPSESGVSSEKTVSHILRNHQGMYKEIFQGVSLMGWHQSAGQLGEKFTVEAHEAGPKEGKITCVTHSNPCAEWADFYMPPQQFTHYGHEENGLGTLLQIRSIDMPSTLTAKNIQAYSLHSILTFFFRKGHKCHQQFVAETEGNNT